jgi:hypothetical protein
VTALITAALPMPCVALARQNPGATPEPGFPLEDQPVDTRARELVNRLHGLAPLAVLEALETAEVTGEDLKSEGAGATVKPKPWNDPGDTDLEHALGGVLIVASDNPVNSPDLNMLGAYIVFESAEIAFAVLMRELEETGDHGSTIVAGTKAWMASTDDRSLAIMRFSYVVAITRVPPDAPGVIEGMIDHLDAVTAGIA